MTTDNAQKKVIPEFFLGPCVLESEKLALTVAETLKRDLEKFQEEILLVFKGSFDKANRTSVDSYRGPGIHEGLRILERIKNDFSMPVVTDFHEVGQASEVANVVDYLQIPAFLCRQTDIIVAGAQAAAKYNRSLKVKKGQFISPEECKNIIEKCQNFLPLEKIIITERGTSFGYNNLVVDMGAFIIIKKFGVRVIHDATHSAQLPGGLGKQTGGKREQILPVAKAALAAGANGIFMETHPDPSKALSDASTQVALKEVPFMVESMLKIWQANAEILDKLSN